MSRDFACFYCDALVAANNVEHDHFPVPKAAGGIETVLSCRGCHDMKDRFALEGWPAAWTEKVVADFPNLSRESRIFLAKAMALVAARIDGIAK